MPNITLELKTIDLDRFGLFTSSGTFILMDSIKSLQEYFVHLLCIGLKEHSIPSDMQ